ncbi:MAG: prepilin-type N-terminal cleavage/methylation domain-containing protein [Magnetococcales bacterium]|nr:prepilin-type N-terminal cleavage/methylation domain-containing protein [Magnetococcales bacterium]
MKIKNQPKYTNTGFTLIEMATVLMIIGLLASLGMTLLRTKMEQTSYKVTEKRMEVIKETLIAYLRVNKKLPCPASIATTPNGDAVATCNTSIAEGFGVIPWNTLGLPREVAIDGWNNYFSYHVSAITNNWTAVAKLNDADVGNFAVIEKNANGTTSNTINQEVLVIVSHGPNGDGAYTVKGTRNTLPATNEADELENTNTDATYIKRDYTDDTGATNGAFDDVVMALTTSDLVSSLIDEGTVQSGTSTLNDQFTRIKGAILAFASQSSTPITCTALLPWSDGLSITSGTNYLPSTANGFFYEANATGTATAPISSAWSTTIGDATNTDASGITWTTIATFDSRNRHYLHNLPYETTIALAGYEDTTTKLADPSEGYVPYATLNLTIDNVTDPWGNQIQYFVNKDIADRADATLDGLFFTAPGTNGVAYRLVSGGPLNGITTTVGMGNTCDGDDICEDILVTDLLSQMTAARIPIDTAVTCP